MRAILFSLAFLFALVAQSATYWVAKDGSDANPGSEAEPKLTIQAAANIATTNDVVNVEPGVYSEWVETKAHGVTYQGVGGEPSVIGFWSKHRTNVFNGFQITGVGQTYAVLLEDRASYNRVVNCTVSNTPDRGITVYWTNPQASNTWVEANRFISPVGIALSIGGTHWTVTNNYFYSPETENDAIIAIGSQGRIVGNTFTNWSRKVGSSAHADLIQAFSSNGGKATNVLVEGNFAINCENTQIGMMENQAYYGEDGGVISDWTWRNNIFVGVGAIMNIYCERFVFYNNTFYRSGLNTTGPILWRYSDEWHDSGPSFIDTGADTISVPGTAYATRDYLVFRDGTDLPEIDGGLFLTNNTPYAMRALGGALYTLHYTENGALYNTNLIDLVDTGSGTWRVIKWGAKGQGHSGQNFNNIFVQCGSDGAGQMGSEAGTTNYQSGWNLMQSTSGGTDPLFVNGGSTNTGPEGFKLQASSPAIGAGTNMYASFTTDFAGVVRPEEDGWDIGAFQFESEAPPAQRIWTINEINAVNANVGGSQ